MEDVQSTDVEVSEPAKAPAEEVPQSDLSMVDPDEGDIEETRASCSGFRKPATLAEEVQEVDLPQQEIHPRMMEIDDKISQTEPATMEEEQEAPYSFRHRRRWPPSKQH